MTLFLNFLTEDIPVELATEKETQECNVIIQSNVIKQVC